MPNIEIGFADLSNRTVSVSGLLSLLRKNKTPVGCSLCRVPSNGCKVISAHDKINNMDEFSKTYFRTYANDIFAQYYEFWKPIPNHDRLFMNRAYFHLAVLNRTTHNYDELIALHCDPNEEEVEEPVRSYKRSPHIHLLKEEQPLRDCHIPLNLMELDRVISSVDSLTCAFESAIQIIRHEVLNKF